MWLSPLGHFLVRVCGRQTRNSDPAISSRIEAPGSSNPDMCCEISSSGEVAAACPVSGQVLFSWICSQAQREKHDKKKGRGGCETWESVLGTSLLSCCVSLLCSKYFLQVFGGGTALVTGEVLPATSRAQAVWTGMARGCSCPKCV